MRVRRGKPHHPPAAGQSRSYRSRVDPTNRVVERYASDDVQGAAPTQRRSTTDRRFVMGLEHEPGEAGRLILCANFVIEANPVDHVGGGMHMGIKHGCPGRGRQASSQSAEAWPL